MGEDVGKLGGVFRVTDGLQKDFGEDRVIDTPLAESGIIGTAIGLALRGYRPVCEIQFDGFVYPAYDQIVQPAREDARTGRGGQVKLPVVVRIPFGGGIGAVEHHSESPEAYFAHTAGLRVVACANPADAYWMIQQAIAQRRPGDLLRAQAPLLGEGRARRLRRRRTPTLHEAARGRAPGEHVTVAAYGPMVKTALDAATAAEADGHEHRGRRPAHALPARPGHARAPRCEKTGRLVVVHEAPVFLGLGAEIAARVTERCFYALEAPVLRVGGFHAPYPPSRLEEEYLPDLDRVLDAVDRVARVLRRRTTMPDDPAVQPPRRRRGPDRGRDRHAGWSSRGDTVKVNDTDRRDRDGQVRSSSCPSPYAGVVTELLVPEGATVDVGTPIIAVDTDPSAAPGGGAPLPEASPRRRRRARTRPRSQIPPAEGAVEPGMIGGPAPGGRTSVLVGYGPRTTAAVRRARTPTLAGPEPAPAARAPPPPCTPVRRPAAPVDAPDPPTPRPPARTCSPSRRSASSPRTSASTSRTVAPSGPGGIDHPRGRRARGRRRGGAAGAGAAPAGPPPADRRARDADPDQGRAQGDGARRWSRSAFTAPHVTEWVTVDVTRDDEARRAAAERPRVRATSRSRRCSSSPRRCCSPSGATPRSTRPGTRRPRRSSSSTTSTSASPRRPRAGSSSPTSRTPTGMSLRELADALAALTATAREGRTQPADMSRRHDHDHQRRRLRRRHRHADPQPGRGRDPRVRRGPAAAVGAQGQGAAALGDPARAELRPPAGRRRARQPHARRRRGRARGPRPRAGLGLTGAEGGRRPARRGRTPVTFGRPAGPVGIRPEREQDRPWHASRSTRRSPPPTG